MCTETHKYDFIVPSYHHARKLCELLHSRKFPNFLQNATCLDMEGISFWYTKFIYAGHHFLNLQLLHFILAVLDVTISEDHVSIDHELLKADTNGYTPEHDEFTAPSCYDVIAAERLTVRYLNMTFFVAPQYLSE